MITSNQASQEDAQCEIYAYQNKQMGSSFLLFPSLPPPVHTPSFTLPLGCLPNTTWEMPRPHFVTARQSRQYVCQSILCWCGAEPAALPGGAVCPGSPHNLIPEFCKKYRAPRTKHWKAANTSDWVSSCTA